MAGIWEKTGREIRRAAWLYTPRSARRYVGFLYQTSKTPLNFPKNFNRFRYATSVGSRNQIKFIPPIFTVTIATTCNLRCPSCLYVLKDSAIFKGGGFIKAADFRTVINRYARGIDTVFLTGGEPLLHPELDNLVQIAKSKGLSVKISTNGILIDKNIDVLKSFNFINVSLDSYDYDSFKRLRGGTEKQYRQILAGISLLKSNSIAFMVTFTLSGENLAHIYKMLEFACKIQPSAVGLHNINPHGSKEYTPLTLNNEKVAQTVKTITSKNDYPFDIYLPVIFDTESKHFRTSKCIQPWYYCCFDDKGDIAYCCHLRHDRSIGNIFNNYDFNSDKMRDFRRLMIKNEYPQDDCLYCQRRFIGEEYGYFDAKLKKWSLAKS